jgi:hypothetical protein
LDPPTNVLNNIALRRPQTPFASLSPWVDGSPTLQLFELSPIAFAADTSSPISGVKDFGSDFGSDTDTEADDLQLPSRDVSSADEDDDDLPLSRDHSVIEYAFSPGRGGLRRGGKKRPAPAPEPQDEDEVHKKMLEQDMIRDLGECMARQHH